MALPFSRASSSSARKRPKWPHTSAAELPASHEDPPDRDGLFEGPLPACPPCPDDPWVVLAQVDLDADGEVLGLDNCSVRRQVISFAHLW